MLYLNPNLSEADCGLRSDVVSILCFFFSPFFFGGLGVQGFMVETAACAAFDPCDIIAALNRLREA